MQVWHYSPAEEVPSAHYDLPLGSWSFQQMRVGSLAHPLADVDSTPIFCTISYFFCHDFLLIHAIISCNLSTQKVRFSMLRKIFKTGNSLVVSLPREILDALGLSAGSDVFLALEGGKIVIRHVRQAVPGVDEDFAHQVAEFIDEYRPALEALAK